MIAPTAVSKETPRAAKIGMAAGGLIVVAIAIAGGLVARKK